MVAAVLLYRQGWAVSGALLMFLAACDCGAASLRVEGPNPYVRCSETEHEEGPVRIGTFSGTVENRTLTLQGVGIIEAFSVEPGSESWLSGHEATGLQVILGGFGRDETSAQTLLTAIADRGPALLVFGGEDDTEVVSQALDTLDSPNLFDLRGIALLVTGSRSMLVVHGALNGRYGLGDQACGYAAADLEALPEATESLLLSWMAPRRTGRAPLDQGLLGEHVGDENLAALEERAHCVGGLHAWPRESAGRSEGDGVDLVVPPVGIMWQDARGGRYRSEPTRLDLSGDAPLVLLDG